MRLRSLILLAILSAPLGAQDGTIKLWTREAIHSAKLNEDRLRTFGRSAEGLAVICVRR